MAKKSRRPNLPASAFNTITNTSNNGASPELATEATIRSAAAPARAATLAKNTAVNWQAEYGEVLGDLKKTGVLALGLLAVMVVLSFVV